MILIKRRQVIMSAAMNPYQGNKAGIDLLQRFTVTDWYQPVTGAMDNVGMTFYFGYPQIGAKVEAKYDPDRENGYESFNYS